MVSPCRTRANNILPFVNRKTSKPARKRGKKAEIIPMPVPEKTPEGLVADLRCEIAKYTDDETLQNIAIAQALESFFDDDLFDLPRSRRR